MMTTATENPVRFNEHARVKLFRLTVRKLNDNDYDVMKIGYRSPGSVIATRKVGIEVIGLLKKGYTLKEVREALGKRYNCTADRIQITPLIDTLMKAKMIKSVDGNTIISDRINLFNYIFILTRIQLNKVLRFLYTVIIEKLLPVTLVYPICAKTKFWFRAPGNKKKVAPLNPLIISNLKRSFPSRDIVELEKIAQSYWDNKLKITIDYQLLGKSVKVFPHWLKRFSSCTGLEYLEAARALNKGVLLCGFHFGFIFLIPLILISYGYNVTTIGYTGRNFDSSFYNRLNDTFSKVGFGEFQIRNLVDLRGLASVVKLLAKGELVIIMADVDMSSMFDKNPEIGRYMGSDTINYRPAQTKVNILGHSISANKGLAWLHLQTGAPLVPARMFRTDENSQQLIIRPALQFDDQKHNGKEDVDSITGIIFKALEKEVYQEPSQWLYWNRIHEI